MPWDQGDIPPLENPPTTEMLAKLEEGFAAVRSYAGFSNFGVPDYVWTYIGPNERDRVIVYVYNAIFTVRADDEYWYADNEYVHREEIFAWTYVLFLLVEWWCDQPNNLVTNREHATAELVLAALENDWGFSAGSLTNASLASGINWFDISISDIKHPAGLSSYFDAELYLYWEEGYSYASIYQNTNEFYYFGREVDTNSSNYNYFWDAELYEATSDAYWGDVGLIAYWPKEEGPIFINGEHEVISARATFKSFGLMDGSVETTESLEEGSQVQVARGGDILFTGIVTGVKASLVDGVYSISISDPVTAGGGEAEYASGNAITAMQEAIEACGGTFETEMETEETVFYPESPVDAWQFFRAVSYAVGGVLQYGRDGVYRLVEGGSGHSVTDSMIIGDDRPTTEERTKDYANRVAASIDQEWRTEAVENTIETFTSPGAGYAEITRFGEQIISQEVNFSGGSQTIYTHDYDENGYCVETIEDEEGPQEIGSMKRVRTLEFSDISEDGNEYKASDVIETYNYGYSPISDDYGWILIARTTLNWDVNLDGISFVEEIEQGTTPIGGGKVLLGTDDGGGGTVNLSVPICSGFEVAWPELWNRRRWVASIVTSPVAGPIEGFTSCNEYAWTEVGISADISSPLGFCSRLGWYQLASKSDKSYTVPKLEMYAPEDTHEVHILAKAEDPDAIDALGEHEYECQAVSLDTETGMQAFALGVLYEKGRIRHANVSVPNDDYLSGDSVIWRGLEWQIDTVTVDLDRCCDIIEMVTTSTLARLQNSISREPVSWIEDVKNVVTKRTGLYDNVSRGRILSQVGFRRYLVQAEGKATPVEAKALTDDPHLVGGSVLLVKPTGKNQPWTLLSLSKEQKILLPEMVQRNITPSSLAPPDIVAFSSDTYETVAFQRVNLTWEFEATNFYKIGAKIELMDGQDAIFAYGNTRAFTFKSVGEFSPVITPFYVDFMDQKIYGTPVTIDAPILVEGPAIAEISVENAVEGNTVFGGPGTYFPYNLVFVFNGEFELNDLKNMQYSFDGGTTWEITSLSLTGNSRSIETYWVTLGEQTVKGKLTFIQATGEEWTSEETTVSISVVAYDEETEGKIGLKEYYYYPRTCDLSYHWDAPTGTEVLCDDGIGGGQIGFTLEFDVDVSETSPNQITFDMPTKYMPPAYGQKANIGRTLGFRVYASGGTTRVRLVAGSWVAWDFVDMSGLNPLGKVQYWELSSGLASGRIRFQQEVLGGIFNNRKTMTVYWNGVFVCGAYTHMGNAWYEKAFFTNIISSTYPWDAINPAPLRKVRAIRNITFSGEPMNVDLTFSRNLMDRLSIEGGYWGKATGYSPACMSNMPGSDCEFVWDNPYE